MDHKQPVVLVVDDEPAITQMLEMLLEDDYQVSICQHSISAVYHALRVQPNLFIIDFMMPQLNGMELLRAIRNQPELSHIPAILMTASTSLKQVGINEADLQTLRAQVIRKPFDNSKLLALMEQLCRSYYRTAC